MNSEFLIDESSPYQPPELLPAEWEAVDQARATLAEGRADDYAEYFTGITADSTFVSVDRPTVSNDFADCVIWTGNVREMAAGAEPTKHHAISGYQMRAKPTADGEPGPQFGRVMTVFEDSQGNQLKIDVPATVDLRTAKRPTISGASGKRPIFTLTDQPEGTPEATPEPETAQASLTEAGLQSVPIVGTYQQNTQPRKNRESDDVGQGAARRVLSRLLSFGK